MSYSRSFHGTWVPCARANGPHVQKNAEKMAFFSLKLHVLAGFVFARDNEATGPSLDSQT